MIATMQYIVHSKIVNDHVDLGTVNVNLEANTKAETTITIVAVVTTTTVNAMTIFLVDLESVETRYTGQWKTHVPALLRKAGHNVQVISGPEDIPSATTPGAFLNFGGTNIYKSAQVQQIGRLFCDGAVRAGDHFIFTDAWHPGIINLKYMSELLGIPVTTHGLWHAGSYDPQDFLGRLVGDKPWVRHAEKSFFHAFDHNYFATDFHIKLFFRNLLNSGDKFTIARSHYDYEDLVDSKKIVCTGWPMEYMEDTLTMYKNMPKRDLILFPHRIAPEKQVEIFRNLKEHLPQYEFVVCQDQQLTKNEYHNLLGEAKLVFSANLQETLGISWYEGAIVGAIPMVPDRLSYSEMAFDTFKYPSQWTENYNEYEKHRPYIAKQIMQYMENYEKFLPSLNKQVELLKKNFFSCNKLLEMLK
jgi:glycosyltransferase involved in cell wall biosynthesis